MQARLEDKLTLKAKCRDPPAPAPQRERCCVVVLKKHKMFETCVSDRETRLILGYGGR